MLWSSLESCKAFVRKFLSYQNDDLFYLTAFVYPRLCYVFITIAKIVFLDIEHKGPAPSSDPSSTQGSQNRLWNTLDVAREAQFPQLSKAVLEKFTAVATDFVDDSGQRDAMANLASAMRILIAGYEQQMRGIQGGGLLKAETIGPGRGETTHATDTLAVDLDPYSSFSLVDGAGGSAFDVTSPWNPTPSTWDDILESFTMVPFS